MATANGVYISSGLAMAPIGLWEAPPLSIINKTKVCWSFPCVSSSLTYLLNHNALLVVISVCSCNNVTPDICRLWTAKSVWLILVHIQTVGFSDMIFWEWIPRRQGNYKSQHLKLRCSCQDIVKVNLQWKSPWINKCTYTYTCHLHSEVWTTWQYVWLLRWNWLTYVYMSRPLS